MRSVLELRMYVTPMCMKVNALEMELFDGDQRPVRIYPVLRDGGVVIEAEVIADQKAEGVGTGDDSEQAGLARGLRTFLEKHGLTQATAADWLNKAIADGRRLRQRRYLQQDLSRMMASPTRTNARPIDPDEIAVLERAVGAWPGTIYELSGLTSPQLGTDIDVVGAVTGDRCLPDDYKELLLAVYRTLLSQAAGSR